METLTDNINTMTYFENHKDLIERCVKGLAERTYYAPFPEHPKAYGEDAPANGQTAFDAQLNNNYEGLLQDNPTAWEGEEVSPYTGEALGVKYPTFSVDTLIENASSAFKAWKKTSVNERVGILTEALVRSKDRFFEIGHATMHTTGQSFMMSFQASGPHAADRAMEAVAMAYTEQQRYPESNTWVKPMGKFDITLNKKYKAVPKGVALVIGCSTFPTWNTVPGMFGSLVTGNPVIVKPHPKSTLAIAIVIEEVQKVLKEAGFDPKTVQLAYDTTANPITKQLAEHDTVKLIDYTGNSEFGNYIESIPNKTVFTEKAGVNPVILDSVKDLKEVFQNLAFSISLYSGQMCTAPQNFFIPETGIETAEGNVSYDDAVALFKKCIDGLVNHPKMGAGTLGAIQNPATVERTQNAKNLGATLVLETHDVENAEYANARTCAPTLLEVNASDEHIYDKELFGPIALVIKTKNTEESIALAKKMVEKHGCISCAAYTQNDDTKELIEDEMTSVFAPVSFNLTGFIWVNQHAAFSDFHVTGGNAAGNASFTNPEFVSRRYVWIGVRELA